MTIAAAVSHRMRMTFVFLLDRAVAMYSSGWSAFYRGIAGYAVTGVSFPVFDGRPP
jgi:hypothetical protein